MKQLGRTRKRLAAFVIALGLCSFFLPLVILDQPFLHRTEWSPLNIASNAYQRNLPALGGHFDESLAEIALLYLLMPLALAALYIPGPPRALTVISGIGFALSFLAKFWEHAFLNTFGWKYFGEHMSRGLAWWILPWIMPALLAICLAKDLDRTGPKSPA